MHINKLTPLIISSLLLTAHSYAAETTANSDHEETLLVTASKQSPLSASARNVSSVKVSAPELSDANVTRTDQLPRVLPGLTMGDSGSLLFQSVSLRGISSAQDFYNPATTLYIDGVPQLSTYAVQNLGDVESVEMLRGPQGTLYGKSAQGGIINIVTQKPDSTARGYVEGGISSRDSYRSKINLSGPIQDGLLYGSATLLRDVNNGAMTNPATGSDKLGGSRNNLGTVRLRLAPDQQPWEANVAVTEECTHATQDTYVPFADVKSRTLDISAGGGDPYLRRCTHSQSLTGLYHTDNWVFSAMSAWQQQSFSRQFPYSGYDANFAERWNQDVQELRAATQGANHPVDMVSGVYRQNTRQKLGSSYQYAGTPLTAVNANTTAETLAAYSDLTWHVTDQFDLGGGLRYSHDKASSGYNGDSMGFKAGGNGNTRDDQVLGQISAGYQFTPALRVYSRIAQGYKPTGYNFAPTNGVSVTPYDAEKSISYEVGTRYEQGANQLQGAVFHTHTKNLQLYSGPVGYQTISNAGAADASGIELSNRWQFSEGWSWNINGNYVRSTFASDSELYQDKRVPFVPRYGAGTSVTGTIDTAWGALMPRLALNVVGPHYFDGDNTLRQGSYTTSDLRVGWQATDRINIAAYIDNMFDRRYRTYGFVSGASALAQVNAGRTAGVDVRVDLF
ncbi:TonB-dependent siderophore receptor [Erwiniaceae bacterium BAC15a-03b]|uniref:TonB-dependent siderophore receptor n=1 Tax=Winslowiella arboricola TaxID=2978220 RepID=A0A9J6PT78_9GAMM|nr:TonB-dependent siderophore receptor [Winslowiella arboricola]MCU5775507.1 TonB-dependent siderophore receptor [Winslowiella arboricola]MCU5779643.1 TonB-dependent siderophore receptor [Winslowiella arboricola]